MNFGRKRILDCLATTCALSALIASAVTEASAGAMQTSPELRQAAMANCTTDVLRLCPTVMFDEQQIFACMRSKRAQLSPNCRSVFDEGAKTVHR